MLNACVLSEQVYMAIARGAWILSPRWMAASLEAGQWQPEEDFPAEVRISATQIIPRTYWRCLRVHRHENGMPVMPMNLT